MKLIIDTDPAGMIATGLDVDDDLAIIMAMNMHKMGAIHVLGMTICSGNTQLSFAMANAKELRRRMRLDAAVPVLAGAPWWPPFSSARRSDRNVSWTPTDASNFLVDTILQHAPNTVTIVCLGPLTNLATAMQQEPSIVGRIQRIVMMGGILRDDSKLDYNFRFDRTAAAHVLRQDVAKIIVPVETCVQAIFAKRSMHWVDALCDPNHDGGSSESQRRTSTDLAVCALQRRLSIQRSIMPMAVNPQYDVMQPKSAEYENGFILWDVVGLLALTSPELFGDWQYHRIHFLPESSNSTFGWNHPPRLNATRLDDVADGVRCVQGFETRGGHARGCGCDVSADRDIIDESKPYRTCESDFSFGALNTDRGSDDSESDLQSPATASSSSSLSASSNCEVQLDWADIVLVPRIIRNETDLLHEMHKFLAIPSGTRTTATSTDTAGSELSLLTSMGLLPHILTIVTTSVLLMMRLCFCVCKRSFPKSAKVRVSCGE